jgi:lysophospholipase L1-like esterase
VRPALDQDVASTPFRLVVLGDSIGYGQGARHPDERLGPLLAAALEDAGIPVDLHVLALPRSTSADLAAQVRRAEPLRPDLAVVVIGANDLARFVPPADAARALQHAVAGLQAVGADVVVVPAPDMSVVPFVPPALRPLVQTACSALQRQQQEVARAAGVVFADIGPVVGAAFAADPQLFSADRFHPSSAGYRHIAEALTPTVVAAARARREPAA